LASSLKSGVIQAALVQFKVGRKKEENLQKLRRDVEYAAAKGAQLIVFPEYLMAYATPGTEEEVSPKEIRAMSEPAKGEFVAEISKLAKLHKINIVATFYERGTTGEIYDSAAVACIEDSKKKNFIYRKIHLFDALGARESKNFGAGDKISEVVDIGTKSEISLGVEICYDIRFPELTRSLTLGGANVIAVPSAWARGPMKEEHWFTMLRARAIENGVYVIAADQIHNGCIGRSTCIDPFGVIVADMGEREGLAFVDLDPLRIREVREKLPLLKHRKEKIYSLTSSL
jgi:predicted amidohydrolase